MQDQISFFFADGMDNKNLYFGEWQNWKFVFVGC